ncbi:MAG TPA: ABC transporter permease [Caldithrix sp.]|nr:ABC transporter permease [Caldithrix sp.]
MSNKNFFVQIGNTTISFFTSVYEITVLFLNTLKALPHLWFYRRQLIEQLYNFSISTLPIAAVISIFVGFGSTVQGTYQSSDIVPRYFTINVIFKSTIIELSPIILSLVLAGKIGASVAAEIGSMRITEQIDALETTPLDPVGFLVLPRVVAAFVMMPVITLFSNFLATFAAFFMSTIITEWISGLEFWNGLKMGFKTFEVIFGSLIKPATFGMQIALIGSFFGLKTSGGARGVGKSATSAVVLSAIVIVILDYYLGELML